MEVELTPDLELFLQAKVDSGQYRSPDEVCAAALTLLRTLEETDTPREEQGTTSLSG
jgi:putative addiction module CopG family antidote